MRTLSPRERQVLTLAAGGLTEREIGQELGISRNTVRDHTKAIREKLVVHNKTQAVVRAYSLGLLDWGDYEI